MIERLTTITELAVDQIEIAERLRDVRSEGVEALKDAIEARGFVGRIVVRRKKGGDFVLDGAHRLTAMRELGRATIPCDVIRCTDDEAMMFELDGNLAGAKMTALELSYFLARRRETYQRLNPETRRGYAATAARMGQTDIMSVCKVVAVERGISERHVYRLMSAGEKIGPDEYRRLASAPKSVQLSDLFQLAKISEAGERYHVVDCLSEGRAKNASAARKLWKAERGEVPAPMSPTDQAFTRLLDAWDRGSKEARKRFLEKRRDDILTHLEELSLGETDTGTVVFMPRKDERHG